LHVCKTGFVSPVALTGSLRYANSCFKYPAATLAIAGALVHTLVATAAVAVNSTANSTTDGAADGAADGAGYGAADYTIDSAVNGVDVVADDAANCDENGASAMPAVKSSTMSAFIVTAALSGKAGQPASSEPVTASLSAVSLTASRAANSRLAVPCGAPSQVPCKSMQLGTGRAAIASTETAQIAVRLPDSSVVRKKFKRTELLAAVRDWVSSEAELSGDFPLGNTFPRRVYDAADDRKQLSELELCPSASLVVTMPVQSCPGPTVASSISAVAASTVSAVGSIASFMSGLVANLAGTSSDRREPEYRIPFQCTDIRDGTRSMAEIRRTEDPASASGIPYDNGNSTQFGSGDDAKLD
jgi:hypothetical protein